MMFHVNLPSHFWLECFSIVFFLFNRLPSQALNMDSPFFRLYNKHLDYGVFRVLGNGVFFIGSYRKNKLAPKSLPCVFIGYSTKHKGYKCLYPPTGHIYISRHVVFDELVLPFSKLALIYGHTIVEGDFSTFDEWSDPPDSNLPSLYIYTSFTSNAPASSYHKYASI